jgi:dihydrodipicolinate synthase/N-acetylneuraminate lyase
MDVEWMKGCATALVTPFTAAGAIDSDRFRALVERSSKAEFQCWSRVVRRARVRL